MNQKLKSECRTGTSKIMFRFNFNKFYFYELKSGSGLKNKNVKPLFNGLLLVYIVVCRLHNVVILRMAPEVGRSSQFVRGDKKSKKSFVQCFANCARTQLFVEKLSLFVP